MRRILLVPLWLLLAAPLCPIRALEPCDPKGEQWGATDNPQMQGPPWYDCSVGDASSLLVAASVIGVVARRRR